MGALEYLGGALLLGSESEETLPEEGMAEV